MSDIPCQCGVQQASWRGAENGLRVYLCEACWCKRAFAKISRPVMRRVRWS